MKAAILKANSSILDRPLEIIEYEIPTPGTNELLVKVEACGICRTDLHIIEGELPLPKRPIICGHQAVGHVVKTGSNCKVFKKNDRIGIAWLRGVCGKCEYCLSGRENLCKNSLYTGYHQDGGFAEYTLINEEFAYRLPLNQSAMELAPLLCAGIIGYRALKRSAIPRGGRLVIYGFGSSAHITIQIAKYWGCEVYVCTRQENQQRHAHSLGATWVGGIEDSLPKLVDSAIVFAPLGDLVPIALQNVKSGGTVSLAGIYMTPIPSLEYNSNIFHEKTLTSVEANTRDDGRELLSLAADIPIKTNIVVYQFDKINEALIDLKQGKFEGTGVISFY